ncbi:hypothetical protein [Anaerotruncus rubiinfantis]|uniref:hypothetical protein n=1 Tax=Anaerotruncus rubiinfantis TaxID=1720200 RepID=UPI0018986802|nr:hypothetical protein [Anaerotruncus rubiinfantis]
MKFSPFIIRTSDQHRIEVGITPASSVDFEQTKDHWQTDWTSDYIINSQAEKYAMRTQEGELVALGAYEILPSSVIVHIIYLESHPESNPTIVKENRKYYGIGKALVSFGIKLSVDCGFGGDVTFEAKTPELAAHYEKDFGAIPLPTFDTLTPPRYLLSGEAAKTIFSQFLK